MRHVTQFPGKAVCGRMLAVLMILSLCAAAVEAQPAVTFPTPFGPGIQIPFNSSQSPGEAPVDYGNTKNNFGWSYDAFQGNAVAGNNALLRMVPTVQGPGALTAMGEADDWVYHMEFDYSGSYNASDFFFSAKAEPGYAGTDPGNPREQRIFAVTYDAAGSWQIKVGNNDGGGWVDAFTGLSVTQYTDLDVHYRAGASTMDFYWDGVLQGSAAPGHGRFDIDLLQLDEILGGGTTSIRNFRLGHIPEPSTLLLLGLGAIGLLAAPRRRRK